MNLGLNKLQLLICHKTKPKQTKLLVYLFKTDQTIGLSIQNRQNYKSIYSKQTKLLVYLFKTGQTISLSIQNRPNY